MTLDMPRETKYDRQPTIAISQDASLCVTGWPEIAAAARCARGSAECTVVVAECYPGVDTDEVRDGLDDLQAETILLAETALRSAGELGELISPFLGDDPVFGRMTEWRMGSLFDESRTAGLRKQIAAARGLVLLYGSGAAYVAQHWDLLLYCDVTRWEIQQRQRAHRVGNLGANNKRVTAAELYKRAYFVDWRAADAEKHRLHEAINLYVDTNLPLEPKMISGDSYRSALAETARRPFRLVPFFDPGPWGREWMRRHFDFPKEPPNFAWCFDCVPEENSLRFAWKARPTASGKVVTRVELPAGATKLVKQTVSIPKVHLWSPEDPFLYQISTRTSGDDVTTRFGMREFHFDTVTQRAYLNGRPYFLRGSNITLHRFFEDPESGMLPWDEQWLHRLLVTIPKQLHWNAFRFCIGPVPDRWLQIADENGLLIENEYMVWTGHPSWSSYHLTYDTNEMISEYTEWMRDNWNHPSVAIWDATNESWLPQFTTKIIPAVRSLDLSNRPWENSYNVPAGGNDPVEDHQYLFIGTAMNDMHSGKPEFKMTDLESMLGPAPDTPTSKTGHAMILNEYGWLWLNRDGTPTLLTQKLYPKLLGNQDTAEKRFALQAYLLGGETEFWRAYRRYAGILHFVYLTASDPKAFTSDHFRNIQTLELEPHFSEAMEQAFNPLGVYLNFWHPTLLPSEQHDYTVAMVNDEDRRRTGKLRLVFTDAKGQEGISSEVPFSLEPLGAQSYTFTLNAPAATGKYTVEAIAAPEDDSSHPTISHRDVSVLSGTTKAAE